MPSDALSTVIVYSCILIIATGMVWRGKFMRDNKSSSGLSASSNATSAGTTFIVCGVLLFVSSIAKIISLLF